MSFNVIPSDEFKKDAKLLIKKFPSLKQELAELNQLPEADPEAGTPLGNNTYKIRDVTKSKGKLVVLSANTALLFRHEEEMKLTAQKAKVAH